jgi:4-hydroxymandelate oxidase
MKTGFCVPPDMSIVNLERKGDGPKGHTGVGIGETLGWTITPSLCWKDLEWLCGLTKLPVMVKGICRADDALTAVRCGAKGIVVSNHGGRQLDGAPPTAESLPRIAQAVASRVPVLVDGGIRHGGDILKALALGATAVQIGRPILWGLAAGGENGVKRVIDILAQDFDRVMALSGCPTIASITRDLLEPSR